MLLLDLREHELVFCRGKNSSQNPHQIKKVNELMLNLVCDAKNY